MRRLVRVRRLEQVAYRRHDGDDHESGRRLRGHDHHPRHELHADRGVALRVPVGTNVAYTSTGISDCTPNRCVFLDDQGAPGVEPECARGEFATEETTLRIEELVGTMTAVNLLRNTVSAEGCPLERLHHLDPVTAGYGAVTGTGQASCRSGCRRNPARH